MSGKGKGKVQVIPPDSYPQMVSRAQAMLMARALRSPVATAAASQVIEDSGEMLRMAVRVYVEDLEKAGADFTLVFEKAHEIRGFAETAGMMSTGRIANGLCRYFEDAGQLGVTPDPAVVALHVSAIGAASRDLDVSSRMNDAVAKQLAVLAARKLAEKR